MRLHRLDLQGFGPFRERQSVDFDAFEADGIFLIAGRTGAGKSSVLDGVCYALFGGVPRYDGTERRLRSDHCGPDDPTSVSLEFSTAGSRWRVTRSPEYERPKRHGSGLTKESPQALLEELRDGLWSAVAARPRDVGAALDEIVGLTQQQFLQVILLAQNRFARFLLARNDERQALLRTLFGTRTYEDYEQLLEERRKEAERTVSREGEAVRLLLDEGERTADDAGLADEEPRPADIRERLDALVRAAERAAYRVDAAVQEQRTAEAALDEALSAERAATALHERQRQRLDTRDALARVEAETPAVDIDRERLRRALAAETLRSALEAADRATTAHRAARDAVDAAAAAWAAAGETATTMEELHIRGDELAAVVAQCADARAAESELAEAEADRDRAATSASAADEAVAELDLRRAAVPPLRERLEGRLASLAGASPAREAARERLIEARERREAAAQAEVLRLTADAAEREAIAAATALVAATEAHTMLLQRRLASAAGDLARDLADGDECPVCGATEHPRLAHPGDDPVTDAALDAAAAAKEEALTRDRVASDAARTARAAHAEAAARAGGVDPLEAESALIAATSVLADTERDVDEAARLAREHAELLAVDAEAAAAREALVIEAADHRQAAALAEQRAEALRARVTAARDTFATISDRLSDVELRRALLRASTEAIADAVVRAQLSADATADRDARVADSDFVDAGAVRAALLPQGERVKLEERVREHDAAARALREALLDLELALADADDTPIDLTPVTARVAEARENLTSAASAHATAMSVANRLRDLAERADAAHRAVAGLAERTAVIARLANTVAGRAPNTHRMTLETFVLAAELEEIVQAANVRLDGMSAGRYRLQHTDELAARGAASGLGLAVQDSFTGQARPPQSLSGGETFLASLALALGLAEVVTARAGGLRLDTLFIDEGFGSLDDDTLELAMRALDELRQGGRTVGVISHVAAMKEQLPAQLAVEITPQGPSVIRQAAAIPAV